MVTAISTQFIQGYQNAQLGQGSSVERLRYAMPAICIDGRRVGRGSQTLFVDGKAGSPELQLRRAFRNEPAEVYWPSVCRNSR
jgi:hypothetical protein